MNPTLIEPGVKYYLSKQFDTYKLFKEKHTSIIVNLSLLLFLFVIIFGFIYISYKGKPNKKELDLKNEKKKQYILSKINNFQKIKNQFNYNTNTITNLPILEKM
jgi:hypothetical protein